MNNKFHVIHTIPQTEIDNSLSWNMPYVPAIKVLQGRPLYISGVNAAPIYHDHPHRKEEFDSLDFSPENQAKLSMDNLNSILVASGATFKDIVQIIVFIVDLKQNAEKINTVIFSYFSGHLPTSTVVGVAELITDPRLIVEVTAVAYV